MKMLRKLLDKVHPRFAKDGKLETLYPLYEALDTFLYTPGDVTKGGAHVRDGIDLKRYMSLVVLALVPCTVFAMWNTGFQANNTIRNRQVGQVLVESGAVTAGELGAAMQASIGRRLDDTAVDAVTRQRVQAAQAKGEKTSEEELRTRIRPDLAEKVQAALATVDGGAKTDFEAIGYHDVRFDWPDWQTRAMQSLGCDFDPGSFLANLVYGALYFLPVYLVTVVAGGLWEALFAVVRRHEINEGFLVTSLLFPLTLPPTIPLWQVALGISFGVVIGKEVFGGTGRNFLNPALTARAFVFFAYPAYMSGERIWNAATVDGFSGATSLTILGSAPASDGLAALDVAWWQAFVGTIQGSMGETSTLCCLVGAVVLIVTGAGSWKIMLGMLGGMVATAWLFNVVGSENLLMYSLPPHWHLVLGGFAFGAVFMATDPVSASMTETGKWWYGGLIGLMAVVIRVANPAFPEGVMLAILLGNVFAPLIDYFVLQANIKRRLARNAA